MKKNSAQAGEKPMTLPKPEGEKRTLFNCFLAPPRRARLKEICRRLSIKKLRRVSEGQIVEAAIRAYKMPPKPSQTDEARYEEWQRTKPRRGQQKQ